MSMFESSLDDGRVVFGPPDAHETERDPVCGMDVGPESQLRAEFLGQTYAFCSPECRQRFMAQPEAFVTPAGEKNK